MEATKYTPLRDTSDYVSGKFKMMPLEDYAATKLGILTDMCIKLTYAEKEHLFSLQSETAIDSFVRKLIMDRL